MSYAALAPFLAELRRELTLAAPDFEHWINTLSIAEHDDPSLLEALQDYTTQLERIGQTAEMLGMSGMSAWCAALNLSLIHI